MTAVEGTEGKKWEPSRPAEGRNGPIHHAVARVAPTGMFEATPQLTETRQGVAEAP